MLCIRASIKERFLLTSIDLVFLTVSPLLDKYQTVGSDIEKFPLLYEDQEQITTQGNIFQLPHSKSHAELDHMEGLLAFSGVATSCLTNSRNQT